jgi:hypothetical protein
MGMYSPKKELFVSQWGKSVRASVLHRVSESLDGPAGITGRAPAAGQDRGLDRMRSAPRQFTRPGSRRLLTNLTFASLVAREWMRRRLPDSAAPEGAARRWGNANWAAAPVWAAEPEDATGVGWAVDPEWAAETEAADRDRAR